MTILQMTSTLYLGCYGDNSSIAVVGSLRRNDGTLEDDVLSMAGDLWPTMAEALCQAEVIAARNIVILTNSPALLKWYVAPEPESTEEVWEQKGKGRGNGKYEAYPVGGNASYWAVMRTLVGYWCRGGRYRVLRVSGDNLKKAQALYVEAIREYQI